MRREEPRDGLAKTPERMEKAMAFLTRGYDMDPMQAMRDATLDVYEAVLTGRPVREAETVAA